MEALTVYLNGEWVPYEQAVLPVEDRAGLFADAVYEVIRVYGGRPFKADLHWRRLQNSAQALRIPLPYDADAFEAMLHGLLERNNLQDASIYIQVSRGSAVRYHGFPQEIKPNTFAIARAMPRVTQEQFDRGYRCITVPDLRWGYCAVKTVGLLPNVLARQQAVEQGMDDALFVRDGIITEASSSNAFFVFGDEVHTFPLVNILPGVTRAVVLEAAAEAGIRCHETPVSLADAFKADEIFLTGTVLEVRGVTHLDDKPIGGGKVGPVTRRIWELFNAVVSAETGA